MKKVIILVFVGLISTSALAYVKCVPTSGGGQCCWDSERDGPYPPIGC